MNLEPYDPFLMLAMAISAVMTLFNVFRYKSRGPRAIAMAIAFASLAVEIQLLRSHGALPLIVCFGVIILGSLVADMVFRSNRNMHKDGAR